MSSLTFAAITLLYLIESAMTQCVKTTHAFVVADATPLSAAVTASGSVISKAIDCSDRANVTLVIDSENKSCQFALNSSIGLQVQCDSGVMMVGAVRVNVTLQRTMWFAGVTFDSSSFRSGGSLRTANGSSSVLLANVSQIDQDGTWNAFTFIAENEAASAQFRPATRFVLALPTGVLVRSVVLRVPTDAELMPNGNFTNAAPPGSFAPQSWVEANAGLAIGLGSLGLFALCASAFFGAVFVWWKRRKVVTERNEMALYGVGGTVAATTKADRRSSVSDVVMVDATDDRVLRSKSTHALLSQSSQNQDAPSIRVESV